MTTKCADCPLRRQELFDRMTEDEVRVMQRFKVGELKVDSGTPLLMEGSNSPQLFTALRGMGLRSKLLSDGRRQVVNLVLPGDFIGLQAALMSEMGHSVEATTAMTLCVFDRSEFWSFFRDNPRRAFAISWLAAVEEHFLGDALTTLGQRTALQAVAWALIKVFSRGQHLDLVHKNRMPFPYRQQDIADALGLSLVHTNRTLKQLRERQLVSWQDGELVVIDPQKLADVAMVESIELVTRPLV
ncbi:cAMP-binding domain of CRP or a regulatory subunit of cAMP-dependent protein kinases [Cognatiyoonia koreensis]|uniref:cAMP-binding domain of CRP or a regulatory subunit of cAMP-dependent protein kinases n=1 Tax=Cognatiyoonia koreensis TaxID=364200 RepID=A0A1I0PXK8_9RHOB|nr:Crp/Fnr family transcriptional regulator [Cognatiyoonia koreensis]SEW19094.1 cAMP-binding domain of CRP or a regulatory subunit of cAMP-dependent protein kinases [Cognatiyoonia koreensis]